MEEKDMKAVIDRITALTDIEELSKEYKFKIFVDYLQVLGYAELKKLLKTDPADMTAVLTRQITAKVLMNLIPNIIINAQTMGNKYFEALVRDADALQTLIDETGGKKGG
jgi:hypothetical protein